MQFLESLIFKLNIHTVPPLVVGILMFVLGLVTMIRDRASKVSVSFFMVTASIFVWLGSLALLYSASTMEDATFWANIEHFGVAFIPSFFFLFTLDITRQYKRYRHFSWMALLLSGLFCAGFVFSPFLIEGTSLHSWGYFAKYGPYGFSLILYVGLFMLVNLILLWSSYVESTSEREAKRLKGIFIGVLIGLIGAVDFAPTLGITLYPFGYIPIFACALILGQTILRFKLIDISSSFAAKQILETMEDLVLVADLEGNIAVVNRALCDSLGYDEKELKDKKASRIFALAEDTFPKILRKDWIFHDVEMKWNRKDGTPIEMSVSASAISDKSGTPAGIVYAATDITDRKETERELKRAKEAAEAANKAKSEFLANMSHEIRTPLNAVIGFSDILTDTSLNDVQKDYLETIKESGKLLLALISDILDFSKIEARQIQLEEIDFDLKNLVEDVLKICRPKIAGQMIELYYNYEENMPSCFKGDPTRIRQIILNLLNNAIKFTEKGEIGVHVNRVQDEKDKAGTEDGLYPVQISVKDTGIGISKDKQKIIFETFTQADSSTTREYGGTGLGLAITNALVDKMGGRIWVESEEGKGSEFLIVLKLKESDLLAQADISPVGAEELKGLKAIVVDDNANARILMRSYCTKAGIQITHEVTSAVDALKTLSKLDELPDVILSDIMMPKMDGYEFARLIKDNIRFRGLKLVAISSDARPGSSREAKASGFDAFMTKPVTQKNFINVLRTVMGDDREEGQIVTSHLAEELSQNKISILVAEDNPVNQKLMKILLSRMGCEMDLAVNGKEAVEKAAANEYDICLMDLQMPVMGGIDATKEIRRNGNTRLPIIALTAVAFTEGRDQCLEAGMTDFLSRPVEPEKLSKKILEWTGTPPSRK
ncbi:MAG: response regulator [Candidatus Aminicenantes bacterium]|nr:response regulator [Candidatus Aminicenantes bacterium]